FSFLQAVGTINNVFFMTTTSVGTKWSIILYTILLPHFVYRYIILERPQYLVVFRSSFGISMLALGFTAEMLLWGFIESRFQMAYPETTEIAMEPFTRKFPSLSASECLV
ncbi:hypothetical protein PENTCL1PPCAC_16700, partial [Pristionchus entomophagus]